MFILLVCVDAVSVGIMSVGMFFALVFRQHADRDRRVESDLIHRLALLCSKVVDVFICVLRIPAKSICQA